MRFIREEVVEEYVHKYFSFLGELLSVPFMGKSLAFSDVPPKKGRNIESPIIIYREKARPREMH